MLSFNVLSKAEAPEFLYFDPKYHFHCQNVSSKLKQNSNISLHTLMNITFIHKPMSQPFLKLSNIKQTKNNLKLFYILYYYTKKVFLGEFTWCTINGKKILFSPIVMTYTFHETTYSLHFLLFKDLFLSWKFGDLFYFVQLPFF